MEASYQCAVSAGSGAACGVIAAQAGKVGGPLPKKGGNAFSGFCATLRRRHSNPLRFQLIVKRAFVGVPAQRLIEAMACRGLVQGAPPA